MQDTKLSAGLNALHPESVSVLSHHMLCPGQKSKCTKPASLYTGFPCDSLHHTDRYLSSWQIEMCI